MFSYKKPREKPDGTTTVQETRHCMGRTIPGEFREHKKKRMHTKSDVWKGRTGQGEGMECVYEENAQDLPDAPDLDAGLLTGVQSGTGGYGKCGDSVRDPGTSVQTLSDLLGAYGQSGDADEPGLGKRVQ